MRVLVDIVHPSHVHFFRSTIGRLKAAGHPCLVVSRDKDVTLKLLDSYGVDHVCATRAAGSTVGLMVELFRRNWQLLRLIRSFRPDVILAKESACGCQAGWLAGVPVLLVDDTDDAKWQRRLAFPFASRVCTDRLYPLKASKKYRHYYGVSPLAYLNSSMMKSQTQCPSEDPYILIRLVSWGASHDAGHSGLDRSRLRELITILSSQARVFVSSEEELPQELASHRIPVSPSHLHAFMAGASVYIGESPTMAAESAILGVPAIHVSTRRLWYTDYLEREFALVHNVSKLDEAVNIALGLLQDRKRRESYLGRASKYRQGAENIEDIIWKELFQLPRRVRRLSSIRETF